MMCYEIQHFLQRLRLCLLEKKISLREFKGISIEEFLHLIIVFKVEFLFMNNIILQVLINLHKETLNHITTESPALIIILLSNNLNPLVHKDSEKVLVPQLSINLADQFLELLHSGLHQF